MVTIKQYQEKNKKLNDTVKTLNAEIKKLKQEVKDVFKLETTVGNHYYEIAIQNSKALSIILPHVSQDIMAEMLAELCDFRLAKEGKFNINKEIKL